LLRRTRDRRRRPGSQCNTSVVAELGEHPYLNEKPTAEQLSVVIEESIRKQYKPGSVRRDAHPKAHGCVNKPGHDLLRDVLRNTLQKGDACMELLVQPRTSSSMDVEDSMTEWKEAQAPFYQVATIRIPEQVLTLPIKMSFEKLSFSPWHALPEHKPLGVTESAAQSNL
jgi:hypothetical protein